MTTNLRPVHECNEPVIHSDNDVSLSDTRLVGRTVLIDRLDNQVQPSLLTTSKGLREAGIQWNICSTSQQLKYTCNLLYNIMAESKK